MKGQLIQQGKSNTRNLRLNRQRWLMTVFTLILVLSLGLAVGRGVAYAADGDLDPTFDGDGKVITSVAMDGDLVNAIALQPDGKIVAAGYAIFDTIYNFAVTRYNPDGSLDTSFSGDGIAITYFGSPGGGAYDVAIQSDGKIVAAGYAYAGTDDDFALVRYNSDGSLDTSFDGDGKVTTDMCPGGIDRAHDVVIQPDGKIVVAGYACQGATGDDFALARYNTDGTLDGNFHGGFGTIFTDFFNGTDVINEVALQPDGKIVAVGYATSNNIWDMALARYTSDGYLDSSFSGDGKATENFVNPSSNDSGNSVAIQPDGKIVVGGVATDPGYRFIVARFNANGSLDTSFDGDGYVIATFAGGGNGSAYGVALQADGKIVATGSWVDYLNIHSFAVARYNLDGSPDSSFGDGGGVVTTFEMAGDTALTVAIQADGKIVAGGVTGYGSAADFALARYQSSLHLPPPPTPEPTPPPGGCTIQFTDVPPDSPFYPFVRCLACRGILSGYNDGTFLPGNNVTRGQLSKIVSNSAGFGDAIPDTQQTFSDVPSTNPFWIWIERMAAHQVISGYPCGGAGEPCDPQQRPYFRWGANATRAQISKIVSNAADFTDPPGLQIFEDVAPSNPFYDWVQRLANRGIMSGYPCGGVGEPCGPANRPYFRWGNNATRGQTSKIVANTFFPGCVTPLRR
jgi:uncharacterized delta-60 repeat protein